MYEGSLPFGSRIAWSLGDGTTIVTPVRDTLRYTYTSAGSRDIEARLFTGRSDSVSAIATTHVDVSARTHGRFISFRMDDLRRIVKLIGGGYDETKIITDPIVVKVQEYLNWEGDRFYLLKQKIGSDSLFIAGAVRGDVIDSIRISYKKTGIEKEEIHYSLLIRNLPLMKDSIGIWQIVDTDAPLRFGNTPNAPRSLGVIRNGMVGPTVG